MSESIKRLKQVIQREVEVMLDHHANTALNESTDDIMNDSMASFGMEEYVNDKRFIELQKITIEIMLQKAKQTWEEGRDDVMNKIMQEVSDIISSSFTEEEIDELYEILKKQVVMKFIRNSDLFREVWSSVMHEMAVKIQKETVSPEVLDQINFYAARVFEKGNDND